MKTSFRKEEIAQFLLRKKNELVADDIILSTMGKIEDGQDRSFSEMLKHIHSIGLKQGNMEGRLEMIDDLIKFFEL